MEEWLPERRVVIVDDNHGFRLVAERFLAALKGIAIAGSAAGGAEGLELVARVRPDVVLVDIRMPGMNGFEFVVRLKAVPDAPPAILVSMDVDEETRREARRLGVCAVLAKEHFVAGMAQALEQALRGRSPRGAGN